MNIQPFTYSIVTLIACFVFSDVMQAQTVRTQDRYNDRREIPEFGIRAGINYSNVWDDQDQEFVSDSRIGFAGGVFVSAPIGLYFGIQPEAIFSQKGYERDGSIAGEDYSFRRSASYIDIPVQLQVKPSPSLTILAGPHYSVLVHDDWEYNFETAGVEIDDLEAGDIRNNLFGLGGGLDINFGQAVLSARAGWDLLSNEGDGETEEPRYKNRWLQFTLGVRF
ncbi:MAG: porin family protein [Balneolaceae bacterium]